MATFGKTTIGGSQITIGPNVMHGSKFTLSEAGTVTEISAYLYLSGFNTKYKYAIYADNSGAPGALKGTSAEGTETSSGVWHWLPLSANIQLSPGTYWLIVNWDTAWGGYKYDAGGTNQFAQKSRTYSSGFPDPFGTPDSYQNREMSIYATYTPGGQTYTKTYNADALLKKLDISKTYPSDVLLQKQGITKAYSSDVLLKKLDITKTYSSDVLLLKSLTKTYSSDMLLKKPDIAKTYTADVILGVGFATYTKQYSADILLKRLDITKTYSADTLLKKPDLTKTYPADVLLLKSIPKTYPADILLKKLDITKTYTADVIIGKVWTGIIRSELSMLERGMTLEKKETGMKLESLERKMKIEVMAD